jgi:hypothetical protein
MDTQKFIKVKIVVSIMSYIQLSKNYTSLKNKKDKENHLVSSRKFIFKIYLGGIYE